MLSKCLFFTFHHLSETKSSSEKPISEIFYSNLRDGVKKEPIHYSTNIEQVVYKLTEKYLITNSGVSGRKMH